MQFWDFDTTDRTDEEESDEEANDEVEEEAVEETPPAQVQGGDLPLPSGELGFLSWLTGKEGKDIQEEEGQQPKSDEADINTRWDGRQVNTRTGEILATPDTPHFWPAPEQPSAGEPKEKPEPPSQPSTLIGRLAAGFRDERERMKDEAEDERDYWRERLGR